MMKLVRGLVGGRCTDQKLFSTSPPTPHTPLSPTRHTPLPPHTISYGRGYPPPQGNSDAVDIHTHSPRIIIQFQIYSEKNAYSYEGKILIFFVNFTRIRFLSAVDDFTPNFFAHT